MKWNPIWQHDIPGPPEPWTPDQQRLIAVWVIALLLGIVALIANMGGRP